MPRTKKSKSAVEEFRYYSYDAIDKLNATYNIIVGQRANGKTYGMLKKIVDAYIDNGLPSAYVRRLEEQIKQTKIDYMFDTLCDYINKKTKGKYNSVTYRMRAFYLIKNEILADGSVKRLYKDSKPFCRTYALATMENNKGADAGAVRYICFDEFITRLYYLPNEFVLFENMLSSIIRNRDGVQIYMLGNTVNMYCPYFDDMGIRDVKTMDQGTINYYKVGKTATTIAVEYCAMSKASDKVAKYYAFDNPQLDMITTGAWEIASYRHSPPHLHQYDIIISFFVVFNDEIIQGDIYNYKEYPIIFFHKKTTPLKNPDQDIIYYPEIYDGNPLHMVTLSGGVTKAQKLIEMLIKSNRTFYSDNTCGELVNNWLKIAMFPKILK